MEHVRGLAEAEQPGPITQVAAKAAIFNATGELLLVQEAAIDTNTKAGQWGLPGGRMEEGECRTLTTIRYFSN